MVELLVVGDANPDVLLSGDVVPRFGQAEQAVEATLALGGSGALAAAALAQLGVRAGIAAAVGDDDLGRLTVARLRARGVDRGALQRSARPTGLSVHLLRGDTRAILTSRGAIADLDVGAACVAIVPGVRHVHLSAVYLVPGLLARGERVLAAARAVGATVSVDTNYDPAGRFVRPAWLLGADVLLPNATEAVALARGGERGTAEDAARTLAAAGPTVVVKLGAAGALAVPGGGGAAVHAPAPPAPVVVDAVGAGDAFDAGFLRARLDGHDLADALALACAAGTLSVRDRGERGHATLDEALALAGPTLRGTR